MLHFAVEFDKPLTLDAPAHFLQLQRYAFLALFTAYQSTSSLIIF